MKILGWRFERWKEYKDETVREAELVAERGELKRQIANLSGQVKDLSAKVKTPFIDADLGDPIPIGSEARKLYVATVAGLHKDILEPKLKFIIANIHKAMEEEGNTDKINNMWVGAIYCARELLRWGDRMVNEQVANQNNQK
jgi:hypothetical protein